MHPTVLAVTDRIARRSAATRRAYLDKCQRMKAEGPARHHLSCSNFAHTIAGSCSGDKQLLRFSDSANIGIVSAYNDMLSAHQPYYDYPDQLRKAIAARGCTAQVAGGVPAMCDGITQGNAGMELSLFSRDVIAMATAIALTHNAFDGVLLLGICDKIVPGLLLGALSFGHLPALFVPAGAMPSGISNKEKLRVRQEFAAGRASAGALMDIETGSYHSPGTCTFYGTANSNQVLLECMGLMLPGSAFINPETPLRKKLTEAAGEHITRITALGDSYTPLSDIVDERSIVNAIVGLLATGGSTNHTMHWIAIARAAGISIDWDDFASLATAVPLLAQIYPNGSEDINAFDAAGGTPAVIRELLGAGLMHGDVTTIVGRSLEDYTERPDLEREQLRWKPLPSLHAGDPVLRPIAQPFAPCGGLTLLRGNLGRAIMKTSAVAREHWQVEAPARIFHSQEDFFAAYQRGELDRDVVVVVRYQGPASNGMPELHKLIPYLANLQDKGFHVALVTDGRLSGASGKVPAAIHVTPEAARGGLLAALRDGDLVRVDALAQTLTAAIDAAELAARIVAVEQRVEEGFGRELFAPLRHSVGSAEQGASMWTGWRIS